MASKRRIRRIKEGTLRLLEVQLKEPLMSTKKLDGGIGRSNSVADLILARNKYIPKPTIQVAKPESTSENNKIISSDQHKDMIFKEAIENRAYYLQKQLEDEKATGVKKPFFKFIRKLSQYSEFVMLTPEMAKELMDNVWEYAEGNRKLKVWLKDAYKRDILNNNWIPSDEGIGIDYNGVVYNGRHRCTALIESGKEFPFYITFNVLEEAKFTTDSGAKRNAAEKLRMILPSTRLANRTAGFCRALMKGLSGKIKYSETEIAEFAHKWESIIAWVSEHIPKARAEVQAVLAKAYLWYGPEYIEPFCSRLHGIKFSEENDPARVLYMYLEKGSKRGSKKSSIDIPLTPYKKTLAAVEAIVNERKLTRLFQRGEDIFQWEKEWGLPDGAWWKETHK